MSATPRNRPYTTRAAAELFAELGKGMRPKGPVTYLEAQWQRVEAQCRLEDAPTTLEPAYGREIPSADTEA